MRKSIVIFIIFLFVTLACSLPVFTPKTPIPVIGTPSLLPESEQEPAIIPSVTPTEIEVVEPPEFEFSLAEKQVSEEIPSPKYLITIQYPYLEDAPRATVFNQGVEDFINAEISSFKAVVDENEVWRLENMPEASSDLRITYELTYQEHEMISILFSVSFYSAGAAHPGFYVRSFSYDVARGQFLSLPELFQPGTLFLEIISTYCINELNNTGMLSWEDGAQPILTNYQNWNLQPDGILISFDPYQVAPGAAGLLQVIVPYETLQEVISPDGLLAPMLQ